MSLQTIEIEAFSGPTSVLIGGGNQPTIVYINQGPAGAAGGTWGSITGTLSSQTDLQDALDLKANLASPTFTGTVVLPSATSIGNVSATEIGYVDGVTSAIQTQLNAKAPLASPTFTGTVTAAAAAFTDGGAQSGSGSFIVTTGGTGLNVGTIPTGTWAARVFNQLDQPTQNGMLVMNRWAAPDSTAFQVGSMYNGASQSFFKIDGIGGTTFSGAMTYGGVTLSNSVTGTGSMVLSASPTFTGPVIFGSTTRPTSAGTGTPDVTDLITRADGDARFSAKALTSSLGSDGPSVNSLNTSTTLVDSGITLTLPAGTYELSGLLYVTGQARASLQLDSLTGVSCALVSHMGVTTGGSTLTYMTQGATSSFSLGSSAATTALSFRLSGRIVLTETRTLKIQYAQNSSSIIPTTGKKESFLTATPR